MDLLVRHASRLSPEILHENELKNGYSSLVTQTAKPMRAFPGASHILTNSTIDSIKRHTQPDSTKLDSAWLVLGNETGYNRLQYRRELPMLLDASKEPGYNPQLLVRSHQVVSRVEPVIRLGRLGAKS